MILLKLKKLILDLVIVIAGTGIFAFGIYYFNAPNQIAPGGITGISIVVNYISGFPIGLFSALINIPLIIIAFIKLGKYFIIKTAVSTIFFSIFVDILFPFFPVYKGDIIIAAVFGGICMGIGLALVFSREGSTGGIDIISLIIQKKKPHLQLGKVIFSFDLFIILISSIVFKNLTVSLYAIISMFISGKVLNNFLVGFDVGKMVFIVTNMASEISYGITNGLNRGATVFQTKGAYSQKQNNVVLCALRQNEYYKLKNIVYSIDPRAFMILTDATEVFGEGFKIS